jgi:aspartate-semialdehyde dehydrogenase
LAKSARIAITGSESLLGREIRDIAASAGSGFDLHLIAGEEEHVGTLTQLGDEPALVAGLAPGALAGVNAVILTGSEDSGRVALKFAAEEPDAAIIDLTFAAEGLPGARLRAPAVESGDTPGGRVHVVAHPAAIALAILIRRLQAHGAVRRSVVTVFAPASEQGTKGIEELQEQTLGMLSFKSIPKTVFDEQLSFNMLARYGQEAPASLETSELRIERHLATLLALPGDGEGAPAPSLRVIQAPVFHGYSFSAWVEFEENPGVEAIENGLASEWIDVRGVDTEPPTNVGQAGMNGIAVGAIEEDRNEPNACWFWLVTDNLRLSAENAVALARKFL